MRVLGGLVGISNLNGLKGTINQNIAGSTRLLLSAHLISIRIEQRPGGDG
jgi:hypothetical protein